MGLAVLTGGAWQGMLATVPGARPVPESSVVLAGARSFDPPEVVRLEASAVTHLRTEELDGLAGAVAAISPAPSGVYLHVDLDVLDTEVARVNVYAAAGGPSGEELAASVDGLLAGRPGARALADRVRPRLRPGGARAADRARPASRRRRGRSIAGP